MEPIFDIFLGRIDGYHTVRVGQNKTATDVELWKAKGYRVQAEHQIGTRLHHVYLVPA